MVHQIQAGLVDGSPNSHHHGRERQFCLEFGEPNTSSKRKMAHGLWSHPIVPPGSPPWSGLGMYMWISNWRSEWQVLRASASSNNVFWGQRFFWRGPGRGGSGGTTLGAQYWGPNFFRQNGGNPCLQRDTHLARPHPHPPRPLNFKKKRPLFGDHLAMHVDSCRGTLD